LPEGRLVEVTVESEEMDRWHDGAGPYNLLVKTISNWKELPPEDIIRIRQRVVSKEDIRQYFTLPYHGEEDHVDQVATCSLLYTLSSPPCSPEVGGVSAAVIARKGQWTGFHRSLTPVPRDFRRSSSSYFYDIVAIEAQRRASSNREVSRAYLNPERTAMHIPLVLGDVDILHPKQFSLDIDSLAPYIRGILLDALTTKPEIPDYLRKDIEEATRRLREDFLGTGYVPYRQDFGDVVTRLSLAATRSSIISGGSTKPTRATVRKVVDLWEDMFYRARRWVSAPAKISSMLELGQEDRNLYFALLDAFPVDTLIPTSEIEAVGIKALGPDNYRWAIQALNHNGYILYSNNGTITTILGKP
jgi:hypothetical protein